MTGFALRVRLFCVPFDVGNLRCAPEIAHVGADAEEPRPVEVGARPGGCARRRGHPPRRQRSGARARSRSHRRQPRALGALADQSTLADAGPVGVGDAARVHHARAVVAPHAEARRPQRASVGAREARADPSPAFGRSRISRTSASTSVTTPRAVTNAPAARLFASSTRVAVGRARAHVDDARADVGVVARGAVALRGGRAARGRSHPRQRPPRRPVRTESPRGRSLRAQGTHATGQLQRRGAAGSVGLSAQATAATATSATSASEAGKRGLWGICAGPLERQAEDLAQRAQAKRVTVPSGDAAPPARHTAASAPPEHTSVAPLRSAQ